MGDGPRGPEVTFPPHNVHLFSPRYCQLFAPISLWIFHWILKNTFFSGKQWVFVCYWNRWNFRRKIGMELTDVNSGGLFSHFHNVSQFNDLNEWRDAELDPTAVQSDMRSASQIIYIYIYLMYMHIYVYIPLLYAVSLTTTFVKQFHH